MDFGEAEETNISRAQGCSLTWTKQSFTDIQQLPTSEKQINCETNPYKTILFDYSNMDYHRPGPMCCCKRLAVMKFCKWAALGDIAAHLFLSVYLTELAMAESIFVPFVISVLMLALLSALYYVGIDKENDGLMIPMVVAKVLFVLMIGLIMIFSWIAYMLSFFSLVQVESPIASLSASDFLLLFSICLTVVFVVMLRILFLLHDGYRYVKKENDRKRMGDDFVPFMRTSMTFRPTSV